MWLDRHQSVAKWNEIRVKQLCQVGFNCSHSRWCTDFPIPEKSKKEKTKHNQILPFFFSQPILSITETTYKTDFSFFSIFLFSSVANIDMVEANTHQTKNLAYGKIMTTALVNQIPLPSWLRNRYCLHKSASQPTNGVGSLLPHLLLESSKWG